MKEYTDLITKATNRWSKSNGFFIALLILQCLYFIFIKGIIAEGNFNISFLLSNVFIPLTISFILLIIWLFSTNRIPMPKRKDLTIKVFLKIDDDVSEKKIKTLAKQTFKDIELEYPKVKFILMPVNYIMVKTELSTHVNKYSHSCDTCLFAKVETGKFRNLNGDIEECIEVKDITFSGKFDVNAKMKIFSTSISLSNELNIRNINKDWSYIESNSLNDKKKIKENFRDTLLFYSGIYLLYLGKINLSLDILEKLHEIKDSRATINHSKRSINANKKFLSAARLNEILMNLFISVSSINYKNKNIQKAHDYLKRCERTFGPHKHSYTQYISLARFSYELDKIDEAKRYTNLAEKIKHHGVEITLNRGFFAILEKNENTLYDNYKEFSKVYKYRKNTNQLTEVISWLEVNKDDDNILFEFAIGTLNYFYSDKKLGRNILKQCIDTKEIELYPNIKKLIVKFLTKGETKSNFHNKYNKKKKRRRK